MSRKVLHGDIRLSHIKRVNAELTATGERLGFDVSKLTESISACADANVDWAFHTSIYLKSESQAWAISVSIVVKLIPDKCSYLGVNAECELGCGSTGRTVSQAVHVITFYQRAIELAAAIEGIVS